ncbi:MAG TPA: hypothetical protein VM012_06895, partial [Flavitalea sp.]|nr:hypothetical protein [Flavitalea sp.]
MPAKTPAEISKILDACGTEKVKVAITDIDGVLRGKVISYEKFKSVIEKGFGFCDVVFGWDAADTAYDNAQFTGWHTGYPDAQAAIDLNTYRKIPWENDCAFFLADFSDASGNSLPVCPRQLLKNVSKQIEGAGYLAFCSQEFEWFNLVDTGSELYEKKFRDLKPLTQGMFGYSVLRASQQKGFFHDLFDLLTKFGVPIEGLHTETGPGVYEAAILYSEAIEAADRAVLFKSGVKQIGHQHGI